MVLRQAVRADIGAMHRVRLSVRENQLSTPTRISHADYMAAIELTGRGWVIEYDGVVIAFAVGNFTNGNIWALFVDPAFEGRGYGKRLHSEMIEWLRSRDLARLWLTTEAGSRAADFYPALGWRAAGESACGELRFELDLT